MARRHEVFVTDEQWEKIQPFITEAEAIITRRPAAGR